jgi:hypothetical protein
LDSLAEGFKNMEVQVVFEYYEGGFMKVGMDAAYTLSMPLDEFHYLTHESWFIFPTGPISRKEDGSIVHGWTEDWKVTSTVLQEHAMIEHPPRIVEDNSRGALINDATKQSKLLKYWYWIQQEIEVGVFIPAIGKDVEYWWKLVIPFEPEADDLYFPSTLMELAIQHARMVSPVVANFLTENDQFIFQTRHAFNRVRVWFCPKVLKDGTKIFGSRIRRPHAEEPTSRDKWFTAGPMAYTFPPIPHDEAESMTVTLFGPSAIIQERYNDEEVQGGKIALIEVNKLRVQKPPNSLDRVDSTYSKQVAYNRRILEAEKEIVETTLGVSQFLTDMTVDEPVFVCVNSSQALNRGNVQLQDNYGFKVTGT